MSETTEQKNPAPASKPKPASYKFGRPTKYKKAFCKQLVEHMEKGFSLESFAAEINCCKQTLYNWQENHPDFLDAVQKGEAKSRLFWERIGIAGTIGKIDNFKQASWSFNISNRFPKEWKHRQSVDQTVTVTAEMRIAAMYAKMTPEQLEERRQEIIDLERQADDAALIAQGIKELPASSDD